MTDQQNPQGPKLGMFALLTGGQRIIDQQHSEIEMLRVQLADIERRNKEGDAFIRAHGGAEMFENGNALAKTRADLEAGRLEFDAARDARAKALRSLDRKRDAVKEEIAELERNLRLEQAGGVLQSHPAEDSVALQGQIRSLKAELTDAVRGGTAVASHDVIDTSAKTAAQRRKIAKDLRSLVLRAFNSEADAIIAGATARNGDASAEKIYRAADQLERLAAVVGGKVTEAFVALKVRELGLAVAHQEAKALERGLEKERRAELREQAKAERELEAERARLGKEMTHYENVRAALEAKGDLDAVARMDEKIAEIQEGIEDVEQRAANIRAGYVYVISNVGAFGPEMVKIGLTRRLDPMDRVRELGDASVPFGFDVHALFFSDDAVAVEAELHRRFAGERVNRVNLRREFFRATPAEVRDALRDITGDLIEFREDPEALQYFESQRLAAQGITQSSRLDFEPVGDGMLDEE